MINDIFCRLDCDYEVRDEFERQYYNLIDSYAEMSRFQHAFLCGVISKIRPQKVLEVGVSTGITTSILLRALNKTENETEVYSVDLRDKCYKFCKEKRTGFIVDETNSGSLHGCRWKLVTGGMVPDFIEGIGSGIDLAILDTAHVLPGELLDFLVILPYMKNGGVVVLHDIGCNLIYPDTAHYISNKILFDVVSSEKKYFMPGDDVFEGGMTNIGAFEVTEITRQNVADVFSALTMNWGYMPYEYLSSYEKGIEKNYGEKLSGWFKYIVNMQEMSYVRQIVSDHYRYDIDVLKQRWVKYKKVFIYGAGYYGRKYAIFANNNKLGFYGFVVSDGKKEEDEYLASCIIQSVDNR